MNGDWETRVVQLDAGATIEIGLGSQQKVFAKLYPDESGSLIYEKLKTLRAYGFGPGERHQAVEPLSFIPNTTCSSPAAEGCQYPRTLGLMRGRCWPGAKGAAIWLAKLHSTPLRIGTPRALLDSGELLPLARRLAKTLCRRPQFLGLALEMIQALEDLAGQGPPWKGCWSKATANIGRFIFIGDSSVTVIDLDRSRPGDPARDTAEFLHRLRMTTSTYGLGGTSRRPH